MMLEHESEHKEDGRSRADRAAFFLETRANDELVVVERDGKVEIFPWDVDLSLSNYVDAVEVEIDQFADYHELRKALR
jgi:hypothetical protein